MPPTQDAMRAPAYSQASSACTCNASSRVGAMASATGRPGGGSSPSGIRVAAAASPNATVLPDPVRAETSRSRPSVPGCSTADCTAVGSS